MRSTRATGPSADRVFVSLTELGSLYAAGAAAVTLVAARAGQDGGHPRDDRGRGHVAASCRG